MPFSLFAICQLVLMGGGGDVADAFQWMIRASSGGPFVVIRASGTDAYNEFVARQGKVASVETLIYRDRASAMDAARAKQIREAAALFIAGGDQWNYVNYWKGTPVSEAIQALAAAGRPIGGTSAGLAVLGEFSFGARRGSVLSRDALANPFDERVALERDFLHFAPLAGIITDSHFVERDRMGRLLVFLARIVQDGWAKRGRGIGIDRETAVLVEKDSAATVVGKNAAYFLDAGAPETCRAGTPLALGRVSVCRVRPGGTFNLKSWTSESGVRYTLSAKDGAVVSTQPGGAIY